MRKRLPNLDPRLVARLIFWIIVIILLVFWHYYVILSHGHI